MKKTGTKRMRHLKTGNARNATEIFYTFPISVGQCLLTGRFYIRGKGMKKNVWIATKTSCTIKDRFTITSNIKNLIKGRDYKI